MSQLYFMMGLLLLAGAGSSPLDKTRGLRQLINVVTFRNEQCISTEPNRFGTCLARGLCNAGNGGRIAGNCAAGIGACCIFVVAPPATEVNQNCSYVISTAAAGAAATTTTATSRMVTVNRAGADICQIRLDLVAFQLGAPTATGCGPGDSLSITTPATGTAAAAALGGPLCGTLTGQHLYLETGSTGTAATLDFQLPALVPPATRMYDIKVTQIECTNPNKPPAGCNQWYTGTGGMIQSLNFGATTPLLLGQLSYSACVRQEEGHCTVQYTVSPLAAGATTSNFNLPPTPLTGSETDCDTVAHIEIDTIGTASNMFCGDNFNTMAGQMANAAVLANLPSIIQNVGSATPTDPLGTDVGYSLRYTQQPC